jgi:hypothetical protein
MSGTTSTAERVDGREASAPPLLRVFVRLDVEVEVEVEVGVEVEELEEGPVVRCEDEEEGGVGRLPSSSFARTISASRTREAHAPTARASGTHVRALRSVRVLCAMMVPASSTMSASTDFDPR